MGGDSSPPPCSRGLVPGGRFLLHCISKKKKKGEGAGREGEQKIHAVASEYLNILEPFILKEILLTIIIKMSVLLQSWA